MFDPHSGERIKGGNAGISRYQDVFGGVLLTLSRKDPRVVGVTPAMASGSGVNLLARGMPERCFDVGIAESHAVTFSAGLAAGGMRPYCNIYSPSAQRAYDQIIHDVALQKLPVVLCFDRAGLVGEDGATHHGCFDMAAYRSIPGVVIAAPSNELELKNMMYSALQEECGPYIIRYPRGYGKGVQWRETEFSHLEPGKGKRLLEGRRAAILVAGPFLDEAAAAADMLGGDIAVYNLRFIKPLDRELVLEAAATGHIVTVEDGCVKGGVHGAVCELLAEEGIYCRMAQVGIPDRWIEHGSQAELRQLCGLDAKGIASALESILI